jgi:hypothetical protein
MSKRTATIRAVSQWYSSKGIASKDIASNGVIFKMNRFKKEITL